MMKNRNLILLLLLASLWGPSFLFIKVAVEDLPPLTLVAMRLTLGAAFLYLILRVSGRNLPKDRDFWGKFIIMGFFANALPFVLFSFGEQYADSGIASIINGTTPIFTVIFAHLFIDEERITPNRLIGVLVGFFGIILIFWKDFAHLLSGQAFGKQLETIGELAFLLASLSYGVGITFSRLRLRGLPPLVGPTAQLICSAAMILPIALIVDRPFNLSPGAPALLSASALGIFGTAFAYLVYYQLIDIAGATFISLVTYLLPPIGVILGMIFLEEKLDWYSVGGMGLILAGVMIVNRVRRPKMTANG